MSNLLYPFQDRPESPLGVGTTERRLAALEQAAQVGSTWLDLIPRRFAADSTVGVKTAAFTPEAEIEWFRVTASGGAVTATVPLAASYPYRTIGFIKTDSGGNAVTLTRSGSDTINGATTLALTTQYSFAIIKSNGISAWDVAGKTGATQETVFAAAPNSDFDVSEVTPVTIITKSITGIAAGDQVTLDVWYTILNDSAANRTYTPITTLGSLAISSADGQNLGASATNRRTAHLTAQFGVSATNLTYGQAQVLQGNSGQAADTPVAMNTASAATWDTSTNDETGTKTLLFTMTSSNATATQTLTLHSYRISKISTI